MTALTYVESSNIEAIGYDPTLSELTVVFKKSGTYVYRSVPQDVFDQFLAAESKGSFLNRQIIPNYTNYSKL
jgi:hypothetical protein